MNEIVAPEACTILRLHGISGNYKQNNNEILTVMLKESNTQLKIKSHCRGIIKYKCKVGDEVIQGEVLCVLSPCPHDIAIYGMCGLCGTAVEITNMGNGDIKCNTGSRMAMVHTNKNLVVNEKTAMEMALKDSLNLLNKRKLSLLIDLDLTILHTTSFPVPPNLKDVYNYTLRDDQNRQEPVNYHTKMRPYLKQFLERMHTKFELHIYTFGNRSYAEKIREFIDPNKVLFGQRIISRDDSFDMQKKTANLKSLFPRGDNMVCIIDDRPEVWNFAPNFIHVKPYIYFPDAGDINNPSEKARDASLRGVMNYPSKEAPTVVKGDNVVVGDTVSETEEAGERPVVSQSPEPAGYPDDDDYLLTLENILAEVHSRFYNKYDRDREKFSASEVVEKKILPDVKIIMKEMRREVLRGCRVSFSGLIPLNQKVKDTQAYQILKNLGAHYFPSVSLPSLKSQDSDCQSTKYTTHLISHCDGTKKVKQVSHYINEINKLINENPGKLSSSVHRVSLVNIYWLWHCYFLWSRVDEAQFLVAGNLQQLPPPEGVAELFYEDDTSQHSSSCNSACNKRPHSDDETASTSEMVKKQKIGCESDEEFLKELNNIDDDSLVNDGGLSDNSHGDESESSFDEGDWMDSNVVLHYTPEQQLEMLREVDDAMNEEKFEKRTSQSEDTSSSSSSSSSDGDDDSEEEDCKVKKPGAKDWEELHGEEEDKEDSDGSEREQEEDSSEEHEWDYGDFENEYKKFGAVKKGKESDDEDESADGLFDDDI